MKWEEIIFAAVKCLKIQFKYKCFSNELVACFILKWFIGQQWVASQKKKKYDNVDVNNAGLKKQKASKTNSRQLKKFIS